MSKLKVDEIESLTGGDLKVNSNVDFQGTKSIKDASAAFTKGTNTTPGISWTGDPNTGINSTAADSIDIITNGVVRQNIDSAGQQFSTIPGGTTLYREYKCRAWVNFNGNNNQTNASGGVTSISGGSGEWRVNLQYPMPDALYAVTTGCESNPGPTNAHHSTPRHAIDINGFSILVLNQAIYGGYAGSNVNANAVYAMVMR